MEKNITLTVGEKDFEFCVKTQVYNLFVNGIAGENKTAAAANFLTNTLVNKEQRTELKELIDSGLGIDLAGLLAAEFRPAVEITVKK